MGQTFSTTASLLNGPSTVGDPSAVNATHIENSHLSRLPLGLDTDSPGLNDGDVANALFDNTAKGLSYLEAIETLDNVRVFSQCRKANAHGVCPSLEARLFGAAMEGLLSAA